MEMTRDSCINSKSIIHRTVMVVSVSMFFLGATLFMLSHTNKAKVIKDVTAPEKRQNVLLLIADDLRPQLSMFGKAGPERLHTPTLEALARRSLVARRAYVQQALCAPSRASFLTGRRPDTTHVYDLYTAFRKAGGNFTTLPQYFKQQGYITAGIGKVYHRSQATGGCDPLSWTEPFMDPPYVSYSKRYEHSWIPVSEKDYKQNPLPDHLITENAIETLRTVKKVRKEGNSANFFLAVGFRKPHLPFVFPEDYMKFYPRDSIHLPSNPYTPYAMPHIAWSDWVELRMYKDIEHFNCTGAENNTLPDEAILDLRRAYFACVSFVDHQIGLILQELEHQGFSNETLVVFISDHGFLLGEHGGWCKHFNFELTTQAPLILHAPGLTDQGLVTDELIEFVDIFPTLVELAGFPPLPVCPTRDSGKVALCREGSSMVPLMRMSQSRKVPWKDRAFSQFPRGNKSVMGYSMRTARFRYTEWVSFDPIHYMPRWSAPLRGAELYDHGSDSKENHNVAYSPRYRMHRQRLSRMLREGWRPALPDHHTDTL